MLNIKVGEVIEPVSHEQAVADLKAVIASYKVQNPIKYELRKEELAAQLAKLEGKEVKVKKGKNK